MILDLTQVPTREYIQTPGKYLLKVIGVEEDIAKTTGNQLLKVTMMNEKKQLYIEDFYLSEKALFKLKIFTKALKMPNVVDTHMMLHRYVNANLVEEEYVKTDGCKAKRLTCNVWESDARTNTAQATPPVVVKTPQGDMPYYDTTTEERF